MSGQLFVLLIVFGIVFGGMIWIYALCRLDKASDWPFGTDDKKENAHAYSREDTETIQELHRGLERMGQRIEALETILMDRNEAFRSTPPPMPREEMADRH